MANNEHAGHHRPPNEVDGQNLKSAVPLNEGFERVLILDSDFRKQGERKVDYYVYCIFVASNSNQLIGERMLLHVLI